MRRFLILGPAIVALTACDPGLPSSCSDDAAQKLMRSAYQSFYKIESQKPAMPTTSDLLGAAIGSFQSGAKARAVQIAAMSPTEIRLQGVREVEAGGAIPERGIKRFLVCEATITTPLPGPEKAHVGIYEMSAGGELQTEIEAAP